jgi:hypothetical protein
MAVKIYNATVPEQRLEHKIPKFSTKWEEPYPAAGYIATV